MQIVRQAGQFILIVCGLGLLFAWLGVYGTGGTSFVQRFVFWSVTMATGAGSAMLLTPRLWSDRVGWPAPVKIGLLAATVSVPVMLVIIAFQGSLPSLTGGLILYGYVIVIAAIVTTGMYISHILQAGPAGAPDSADPTAAFRDRLPIKLRTATLQAVSSEDHYLRVHTDKGDDLILMRMADAVRELAKADGAQVHRSWWVARAAIADEKRDNGRRLLVLRSGLEVPVSRGYQAAARAAGLIS